MPRVRSIRTGLMAILISTTCFLGWLSFSPLPNSLNQPLSRILLSRDGELMAATIASDHQWRFPSTDQLPDKYITALITYEDKRFYHHPGVDPVAVMRAALSNYRADRIVSGGSTLTMQLARMLKKDPPRTWANKLREVLLALKLEWRFNKDELLRLYASHAPFGGNLVGLDSASWRYFNRQPGLLSWAEAALLAVLPNSPSLIHPGRNRELLRRKRNKLLHRLNQNNAITDQDLQVALLEPLPNGTQDIPRLAPHLLLTASKKQPDTHLWRTTLDSAVQKKARKLTQRHSRRLADEGIDNLAAIVIDNRTLQLLAYIGNITHRNVDHSVDIASSPRSTGSILKPLLYAGMLESGALLPNTLVPDVPSDYNGFTPENYDRQYRGAVPAKQALARSLNIPAVHMLQHYGIPRFHKDLQQLGLSTLFRPADDYGLSLILGGAEANLYEITAIYAQLMKQARDGERTGEPSPVHWLTDRPDALSGAGTGIGSISQGSAWLTLDALREVSRPGINNHWRQFGSSQTIAWKTGTSYGLRDAWAVGSNNYYTIGVWAGNAGGEGVQGLSGLNSAAPTLFELFESLPKSSWPDRPDHALKTVSTCIDDGFLSGDRCNAELSLAPRNSHFQTLTPYHKAVQLDASGRYRVHGNCEPVSQMQQKHWLVLPPVMEHYWKKHHPQHRSLPPWRTDCIAGLSDLNTDAPMEIVYPNEGSRLFIPRELSGSKGRAVLKATHRNPTTKVHWHLDDEYLNTTSVFHELALDVKPGWHRLVLVDELGFRQERWFNVVSK